MQSGISQMNQRKLDSIAIGVLDVGLLAENGISHVAQETEQIMHRLRPINKVHLHENLPYRPISRWERHSVEGVQLTASTLDFQHRDVVVPQTAHDASDGEFGLRKRVVIRELPRMKMQKRRFFGRGRRVVESVDLAFRIKVINCFLEAELVV